MPDITPTDAARRFRRLEKRGMHNAARRALRLATSEAMKRAEKEREQTGALSRALWGKGKGVSWKTFQKRRGKSTAGKGLKGKFYAVGVPPIILGYASPDRVRPGLWRGGVQAFGMAGLIEAGGKIRPHTIARAWGKHSVRHPGASVLRRPILPRRAIKARAALPRAIDKAFGEAIIKAGLG